MELLVGDRVALSNSTVVDIVEKQEGPAYHGLNSSNGTPTSFRESDIVSIEGSSLQVCGGDKYNYWMFYTGIGYSTTKHRIAYWARTLDFFRDMPIDEIIRRHLYWATDSPMYMGIYNGDTYVLYAMLKNLPEALRADAERDLRL